MDIILYLFNFIKYQQKIICQLLNFICKYIPLKQWAFDDSHSPKYQKFKIDELPKLISFKQDWIWTDLIYYYERRYNKTIRPVFRRVECDIPADCCCPKCEAPVQYLTWNDGKRKTQISDNRGVGPCIMSMRMAFKHLKEFEYSCAAEPPVRGGVSHLSRRNEPL